MLATINAISVLPAKVLAESKKFYQDTLGLGESEEKDGGLMFTSGNSRIYVHESPSAGTNQSTALSWIVDDINKVVEGLKENGVQFEHYDIPGFELVGDIHVSGEHKSAWFLDPSGNILSISQF
jgi:catechol 2,3-dioxygenase-like lactoylglutathione lyase family enzyme